MKKTRDKMVEFIHAYLEERGYPPTIREIGRALGFKSTKAIKVHLDRLEAEGRIRREKRSARAIFIEPRGLKIVGRVAAGLPNLAFEDVEGIFSPSVWRNCFLLRVKGDSMIGAHIQDGDLVVVKPQKNGEIGDIVVAISQGETTVKRLAKIKGRPVLKPENDNYPVIETDTFEIVGKVIGVIRIW